MSSIERNLIKTELIQRREEGCDVGVWKIGSRKL